MLSDESPKELRREIMEIVFELGRLRGRAEAMLSERIEQLEQEEILNYVEENEGATAEEISSHLEETLGEELQELAELPTFGELSIFE